MPNIRNKRNSTRASFSVALDAAQERLAKAIQERAQCQHKLAMLQAEIPSLQQTIVALGGHLEGRAKPLPVTFDLESTLQNAPSTPLWKEPDMNGVASIVLGPNEAPPLPNLGSDEEWK